MFASKTLSRESRTAADGLVDCAEDCEALWDNATSLRTSLTPCDMDEKFRTVICIANDWR